MKHNVSEDTATSPAQEQAPREQLAWRRPQLKRLRVSLDTASSPGSSSDGGGRPSLGV